MTLLIQFEKIRHLINEMQLALYLANHAPDDFAARTQARHVLIRAENFIEHIRLVRRPLLRAGVNVRSFHKAKEIYADHFAEYFRIPRDKLSAHVQDFDFGKRIELWNDIEATKIGYFVDGALELYEQIGKLGAPDFLSYAVSPELSAPSVQKILDQYKNAHRSFAGS